MTIRLRKTTRTRLDATKRADQMGVLNHQNGPYARPVSEVISTYRVKAVDGNYSRVGGYWTTPSWCSCPDHKFRRRVCKHMTAVRAFRERVR